MDKNTQTTLGTLGYITLLAVSGVLWLSSQFSDVRDRIARLETRAETAQQADWDRADQRVWATELQRDNPDIDVPVVPKQ